MGLSINDLGVQSWCYRNWKDLPGFLTQLKNSGVTATEICGVQIDFSKPEGFAAAIKTCKDAGVRILSIGVQGVGSDPAKEENYFKFCQQAGAKFMSISFAPTAMWDGLRATEKLADKYDVKLGIHNHGGYDWLGNTTILDYVFKNTSPRIGLCLDTAWALDAKQNPIEMAEKFKDRLYGVHIKDFIFDRARNSEDVVVGTGNLDLPKLAATLKKNNFNGYTVLEYEGDVNNPVPAISKCVAEWKKVL